MGRFRLLHLQNTTCGLFNLAGICQPALFNLQATPFSQPLILESLKGTELYRQKPALVPGIDNSQGTADISNQNQNQN